jgi:hypothetical protein
MPPTRGSGSAGGGRGGQGSRWQVCAVPAPRWHFRAVSSPRWQFCAEIGVFVARDCHFGGNVARDCHLDAGATRNCHFGVGVGLGGPGGGAEEGRIPVASAAAQECRRQSPSKPPVAPTFRAPGRDTALEVAFSCGFFAEVAVLCGNRGVYRTGLPLRRECCTGLPPRRRGSHETATSAPARHPRPGLRPCASGSPSAGPWGGRRPRPTRRPGW